MKYFYLLISLLFLAMNSHSQPSQSWVHIDSESVLVFGGIHTSDYSHVLVGLGSDSLSGITLARVARKYNCNGQLNWHRFDGMGRVKDIVENSSAEFISIGDSDNVINCTKLDAAGNKIWGRNFPPLGNDHGYSIDNSDNGGFIILGQLGQIGPRIIRIDSMGITHLDTIYPALGNAISIVSNGDNSYTFLSQTISGPDSLYLCKLDSSGTILWQKSFYGDGGTNPSGKLLTRTNDLGYAFSGSDSGYVALYKTDSSGNLQFKKTYFDGVGACLQQTRDSGYLISGQRSLANRNFLIKTDSNGDSLWAKTYGTSGLFANFVTETLDSGILFAGVGRYDTTIAYSYSYQIKYNYAAECINTGINTLNLSEQIPIYPNPADNYFTVALPTNEQFEITIYDFTGRKTYTYSNISTDSKIDCANLSNGIYIVNMRSKDSFFTNKLIKQ